MFIRITCLTIGLGLSIPAQAEPVYVSEPINILAPVQHMSFRELDEQIARHKEREYFQWRLSDLVRVGQAPSQSFQRHPNTHARHQGSAGVTLRVSF
jgi:hypothetical protein